MKRKPRNTCTVEKARKMWGEIYHDIITLENKIEQLPADHTADNKGVFKYILLIQGKLDIIRGKTTVICAAGIPIVAAEQQ